MSRFVMDLSTLAKVAGAARGGSGSHRWDPSQPAALHSEIFAGGNEGVGAALALALAGQAEGAGEKQGFLWVQDAGSIRRNGRPYRPGLPPDLGTKLIHVAARKPEDVLFALEEGLRCRDFACVIGEMAGNPRALDFTASRRLTLAAERYGVRLFLIRYDAARDLSSARMRWQAAAAPSPLLRWNAAAPGPPAWRAELFRSRAHVPGEWILRDDGNGFSAGPPDHGHLAEPAGNRSLATR